METGEVAVSILQVKNRLFFSCICDSTLFSKHCLNDETSMPVFNVLKHGDCWGGSFDSAGEKSPQRNWERGATLKKLNRKRWWKYALMNWQSLSGLACRWHTLWLSLRIFQFLRKDSLLRPVKPNLAILPFLTVWTIFSISFFKYSTGSCLKCWISQCRSWLGKG